ncbi:MAG TPA: hypothetical protein VG013_11350 [Gemmataceae bacterium]|nr:hypothetical protein [Gemmataceae bacterium]
MATPSKRWRLAVLILTALACGAGCDIMTMPYFIFNRWCGKDSRQPPELLQLASEDKDKEVKVVILAYAGLESRPELITADRDLTTLLTQQLQRRFKEAKEKVTIVSPSQVQHFKDTHPNWYMDLQETGKRFDADYLIYLQVESLSLYEVGSHNTLYHGRAEIEVSALDLHKPDDIPLTKSYRAEFPQGRPVPADDSNPRMFQQDFFNHVGKDISRYFASYDFEELHDDFGL